MHWGRFRRICLSLGRRRLGRPRLHRSACAEPAPGAEAGKLPGMFQSMAKNPGFHNGAQTYLLDSRSTRRGALWVRPQSPPRCRARSNPVPTYAYRRLKMSSASPRQVTRNRRTSERRPGAVSTRSSGSRSTPVLTSPNCPYSTGGRAGNISSPARRRRLGAHLHSHKTGVHAQHYRQPGSGARIVMPHGPAALRTVGPVTTNLHGHGIDFALHRR
jgi:hypothetical protein